MGKGGARHTSKPMVDSGLLYTALAPHMHTVAELGVYEKISASNGPDYSGLANCADMWRALLKVESSGEIHPQPLKVALISLLAEHNHLNKHNYTGQTWVSLRVERINCVLTHLRKIKREGNMQLAAAKLNREQYNELQAGLQLMKLKEEALEKATGEKGTALENALEKAEGPATKKLKQKDSDVSMNSMGLPAMFDSPKAASALEKEAVNPLTDLEKSGEACSSKSPCLPLEGLLSRRRPGSRVPEKQENLQDKLGYTACAKSKKKKKKASAKACAKKVEKKGQEKPLEKAVGRKPWVKIHKTMAKNPRRAYLLGSTGLEKPRLIVEVSEKRCPEFEAVIDDIKAAMQKDHLTKEEALAKREELCAKHGC